MSETVFLKVTSAFMVGGDIAKAGDIVAVTNTEAKDLLARGKAEPATAEDAGEAAPIVSATVGVEEVDAPGESDESESDEEPEPQAKKGKK